MAKPSAQDVRERVIAAIEEGESQSDVARRMKRRCRTVVNYGKRWRERGSVEPDKFGGHKRQKLADQANTVRALVEAEPDQRLAELQDQLAGVKIQVSPSALDRFLRASGLTHKKNAVRPRAKAYKRS